jgi:hypothetical protein
MAFNRHQIGTCFLNAVFSLGLVTKKSIICVDKLQYVASTILLAPGIRDVTDSISEAFAEAAGIFFA